MKKKINKSSIDGQFVSDEELAANPKSTYSQEVGAPKRFRLNQDQDCHWYLIPDDEKLLGLFNELNEAEEGWADDRWQQFEDMRIDGYHRLTFENPAEE
jgi:hypothetical protein